MKASEGVLLFFVVFGRITEVTLDVFLDSQLRDLVRERNPKINIEYDKLKLFKCML